jgi:lysine 2,3-aminomutase
VARSRVSAAVCLVRGHGADRECFLVQRNPKLRFLGGFWAFAGGTLEEMDQAAARGKEDALLRCARRELFEETGVLSGFASSGTSSADAKLFELRQTLLDGHEAARTRAVRELEAALGDDGLALTRIARIETPPFVPRRYDTEFWLAQLPEEAEASIVSGELVDGRWLRPEDALSQWRAGELWIAPPVRFLIEELAAAADLESFVASARSKAAALEQGELHPVWFVPGLFMAPLATRTLPPATTTNCYIIGEQQLYVVDPASPEPSEQERLFAWLDARLAEGKRLEAVLLTHGHPDHTGAAAACCARYQVPLLAHPATLQQVPGQVSDSRALLGNERLSLGTSPDGKPGWELHVWHTPGHHPGHLCFVESRYGAALLGDLVSTISTIVIDPPEGICARISTRCAGRDADCSSSLTQLDPAQPDLAQAQRRIWASLRTGHRRQMPQRSSRITSGIEDNVNSVCSKRSMPESNAWINSLRSSTTMSQKSCMPLQRGACPRSRETRSRRSHPVIACRLDAERRQLSPRDFWAGLLGWALLRYSLKGVLWLNAWTGSERAKPIVLSLIGRDSVLLARLDRLGPFHRDSISTVAKRLRLLRVLLISNGLLALTQSSHQENVVREANSQELQRENPDRSSSQCSSKPHSSNEHSSSPMARFGAGAGKNRSARRPKYVTRAELIPQLDAEERDVARQVADKFVFRSNEYYQSLIDWDDPNDPIRRIIMPNETELEEWGQLDASDEASYTKVPGLEHKYSDTALLLVNDVCGGYCRFCFRKRLFMDENDEVVRDVSAGLDYIRQHPEISNVLLTGGDPLILSTAKLRPVLRELRAIEHVQIIRIGSKMPAFNPFRITEDPTLLEMFREFSTPEKRVYLMAHFNHPRELTPEAVRAMGMLQKAGVITVNQSPLLRGINDDADTLAAMFDKLSFIGVPPYYMFCGRPTEGEPHLHAAHRIGLSRLRAGSAQELRSRQARQARHVASHWQDRDPRRCQRHDPLQVSPRRRSEPDGQGLGLRQPAGCLVVRRLSGAALGRGPGLSPLASGCQLSPAASDAAR